MQFISAFKMSSCFSFSLTPLFDMEECCDSRTQDNRRRDLAGRFHRFSRARLSLFERGAWARLAWSCRASSSSTISLAL